MTSTSNSTARTSTTCDHPHSPYTHSFITSVSSPSKGSLLLFVQLIGALSSLQLVDHLKHFSRVLFLTSSELYFFKASDVVCEIVSIRLKAAVEHLKMLTREDLSDLFDVVEEPVYVLIQALLVVGMVPPCRYALLYCDTVL